MSATMPKNMISPLAELADGETLLWAYAPERSTPRYNKWARIIGQFIYAANLIFLGFALAEISRSDQMMPPMFYIIMAILILSFWAWRRVRHRFDFDLSEKVYSYSVVTDQRLSVGNSDHYDGHESIEFYHYSRKDITLAKQDFHNGSPCIIVQVNGSTKPLTLIGGFDHDAALAALKS